MMPAIGQQHSDKAILYHKALYYTIEFTQTKIYAHTSKAIVTKSVNVNCKKRILIINQSLANIKHMIII